MLEHREVRPESWNSELARLGLRVDFDSATIANIPIPEAELRAASEAKLRLWTGFADARLRLTLANVPGDLVIALSHTDLISFSMPWQPGRKGVVGVRRWPRVSR